MLSTILLAVLLIAALLAAYASRAGISPWWTFLLATLAAVVALGNRSEVSTCQGRDSAEAVFGIATLVAIGLYATSALTALFDAVRLARIGEGVLATRRLVPLLLSAGLAFGTLALWVVTVVSCLS
jgi:hypothetical protein